MVTIVVLGACVPAVAFVLVPLLSSLAGSGSEGFESEMQGGPLVKTKLRLSACCADTPSASTLLTP